MILWIRSHRYSNFIVQKSEVQRNYNIPIVMLFPLGYHPYLNIAQEHKLLPCLQIQASSSLPLTNSSSPQLNPSNWNKVLTFVSSLHEVEKYKSARGFIVIFCNFSKVFNFLKIKSLIKRLKSQKQGLKQIFLQPCPQHYSQSPSAGNSPNVHWWMNGETESGISIQ